MRSSLFLLAFLQTQALACSSSSKCPRKNKQLYLTEIVEYLIGQQKSAYSSKQYSSCMNLHLRMEFQGSAVSHECQYLEDMREAKFLRFTCALRIPAVNYHVTFENVVPSPNHLDGNEYAPFTFTLHNVSFAVTADTTYWGVESTLQDEVRISAIESVDILPDSKEKPICRLGRRTVNLSVNWELVIRQALRNIIPLSCHC